jgi:hypothetical protein
MLGIYSINCIYQIYILLTYSYQNQCPRWSLHIIKVWGDLLNKNALRWALAKEDYVIIGTMFRQFRRQGTTYLYALQTHTSLSFAYNDL